ncbi:SO_0444 family Cu/Zn efflux transporter [Endozoicomonas sp. G2_1]|uniref:SO_0444 family Cu/Zn efflux transporter n=1 Tax=Endozoicomonas sp. G2_1 TaxID=2821091 RepID=UPI001FFDF448|nr:SO_0444 family Cu/Zn efflux transporter [Endozoicomonas sp. G2_1]
MDYVYLFIQNLVTLTNEASPWLLLGLLIAGLMKVWLPSQLMSKHLGQGKLAIVKAALIGAPLPLCSCGVIPVATELRRSGASAPATSSFLVATPETGVDSVSVSYALLGPLFAIYRPIAAISSAILTGLLVTTAKVQTTKTQTTKTQTANASSAAKSSCCSSTQTKAEQTKPAAKTSCCGTKHNSPTVKTSSVFEKTRQGVHYAATKLVDDIILWLSIGLLFATIVRTFIPESLLLSYGSGLPAMLLMIAISIPMYICATASTPIAAGFILAGISPGTALVFMMAGPATNISTLGVIKTEMGAAVLFRYLVGVGLSAIGFGLLLDYLVTLFAINIGEQMQHSHALLPSSFNHACSTLLVFLSIKPLRSKLFNSVF